MADRQFSVGGVAAAPAAWVIPEALEIVAKTAYASFDGSAAAGAFLPCLRIISDSGHVVAEAVASTEVVAGASADVSWFRGLAPASQQGVGGSGPAIIYSDTVVASVDSFSTGPLSQAHTDLLIVTSLRTDEANVVIREDTGIQISGDTDGSRYRTQRISLRDTTVASQQSTAAIGFNVLMSTGASADAGAFAPSFFYIPNYTQAVQHAGFGIEAGIGAFTGFPTNSWLYVTTARHNRAEAVTSLIITGGFGGPKFVPGSSVTIYGLG